ncbi:MAG: reactive intermediate/imine deaminase [Anaerolineae bacterium]|nr:reactive intermediate/imine deaminase [Anaerolineae bacterium]
MTREIIVTSNAPGAIAHYSQGIRTGNFVFVSGQGGLIPGTKEFAGDTITAQTEQTLKNIAAILDAAGTDMAHVVKVTVLLTDINDFAAMNAVYSTFFPTDPPARAAYAVKDAPLGALVEIEAIAVMPDKDQ